MRVLLVDDEVRMVTALARGLEAEGISSQVVHTGLQALEALSRSAFDAVVLDIMLPGASGYEVLKRLRARKDMTPVLVLSAKDGEYDVADALDLGADDYLTKPFSYVVLIAKLHALRRRARAQTAAVLTAGSITLDPSSRRTHIGDREVDLTVREFRVLERLMRAQGAVVSKLDLLEHAFDAEPDRHPNVVEVYVGYLRRKVGAEAIETVRGGGYRIAAP